MVERPEEYILQRTRNRYGFPELELLTRMGHPPFYLDSRWRSGGSPVIFDQKTAVREAVAMNNLKDTWTYEAVKWEKNWSWSSHGELTQMSS